MLDFEVTFNKEYIILNIWKVINIRDQHHIIKELKS